jgi:hypothetical protein
MEISDASREQALNYLKIRGIDDELALRIYWLVGGRMVDLWTVANAFKIQKMEFEGMSGRM